MHHGNFYFLYLSAIIPVIFSFSANASSTQRAVDSNTLMSIIEQQNAVIAQQKAQLSSIQQDITLMKSELAQFKSDGEIFIY